MDTLAIQMIPLEERAALPLDTAVGRCPAFDHRCTDGANLGNTNDYCGSGCQPDFGTCGTSSGASVPGLGYFTNFVTYSFANSSIMSGLQVSDYTVNDLASISNAKFDHSFSPSNVEVSDGYLVLKVPGGQKSSPITCGEVTTSETEILYASIRTTAILTEEPGVVDGG